MTLVLSLLGGQLGRFLHLLSEEMGVLLSAVSSAALWVLWARAGSPPMSRSSMGGHLLQGCGLASVGGMFALPTFYFERLIQPLMDTKMSVLIFPESSIALA